jgi:hypothetical protein
VIDDHPFSLCILLSTKWVNKQRANQRKPPSSMTEDRIQALEKLGFEWAKPKGDDSWNANYKKLCEYHTKHGNADVLTKNKTLGRWISTQRDQYKQWKNNDKTQMTEERYQSLCEIGFMFAKLNPKPKTHQVVVDREEVDLMDVLSSMKPDEEV